ncbi:prolyl 4-hydroxylase subunit alpha-2-like isoform X2 [Macrosteles quadrilineatus]|uniref:prolyl 4-hydroxylase subunit alpha-2-like isoform X2 n=1 Tax=Macrosteles quadrilineatus TaxID=74068 RepID=UPI0023E3346D|nr:prolyl 4-hydroxylase subunit alpha-2-like isoform X2 [Macrosteles quadrilineatus]
MINLDLFVRRILVGIFVLCTTAQAQRHFLSIEDLEEFYDLEEKLVKTFTTYLEEQKQILQAVSQHYEEQQKHQPKINNPDEYLGNPLNVHALLKRLVNDWPLTLVMVGGAIADEEDELIDLPNIDDYYAAVHSIARLQQVYGYSIEALVYGSPFHGTDNTSLLTVDDCLAVGKDLFKNHHYHLAVDWFKEALAQAANKTKEKNVLATKESDYETFVPEMGQIYEYTALAICFTGDEKLARKYFKKLYHEFPEFRPTQELIKDHLLAINDTCKKLTDNESLKPIDLAWEEDAQLSSNYSKLCRAKSSPSKTLRCHLGGQEDPRWLLRPFKIEYLHLKPDVYLTYDVIHQTESEFLMREMIDDSKKSGYTNLIGRVQQYWGPLPANSSVSESLLLRANWIAAANMHNTLEQTYLSAFPPGGELLIDRDIYLTETEDEPEDISRHGSTMFFLQQPQAGGLMAFPYLGLAVAPVAGAALTYLNVDEEENIYENMVWGSCPVIQGRKTTLNMWFQRFR